MGVPRWRMRQAGLARRVVAEAQRCAQPHADEPEPLLKHAENLEQHEHRGVRKGRPKLLEVRAEYPVPALEELVQLTVHAADAHSCPASSYSLSVLCHSSYSHFVPNFSGKMRTCDTPAETL